MGGRVIFLAFVSLIAILNDVTARAVNISNTWVLPEDGFPVFYRYFRDRISWYEADAVCQFHHANLVTVDSTSQYDAIRAYLKELDITNSVWIGLQRNNRPDFSWRDFKPLSNNNHWQEAIPKAGNPLCVAMDPAADYRWHALSCGGESTASFICELPVPTWATGPKGCLLTELPSLTVLYIPDKSALELTSDCGLDGTKRIACKGDANHDEMVKQLACTINNDDYEERTTKPTTTIPNFSTNINENDIKTTRPWILPNTVDTTRYSLPTRHRRHTTDTVIPISTESSVSTANSLAKQEGSSERQEALTTSPTQEMSGDVENTMESHHSENPPMASHGPNGNNNASLNDQEVSSSKPLDGTIMDHTPEKEYTSLDQRQIFSIIENGTIFDVIELNGTEQGQEKVTTIRNVEDSLSETTYNPLEIIYTTIIQNKDATEEVTTVSQKTSDLKPTKKYKKYSNNLLSSGDDKSLNKEIEILPQTVDSPMTKLNRTDRKHLPDHLNENIGFDLDLNNKLSTRKGDQKTLVFVMTNGAEISKKRTQSKLQSENKEHVLILGFDEENIKTKETKKLGQTVQIIEDKISNIFNGKQEENSPKFEEMSLKYDSETTTTKNQDEDKSKYTISIDDMISTTEKPKYKIKIENDADLTLDEYNTTGDGSEFSSESTTDDGYTEDSKDNIEGTGEPLYTEPQVPPRPNRQRQLTKSQRKAFYPYFFSRMLG